MSGKLERARAALNELAATPELSGTQASAAELARAEGELAYAEHDVIRAELALRRSIALWLELGSPLQAAHVRLRLCELLQSFDATSAELELGAAETVFRQVGAEPMIERCLMLHARARV